MQKMSTEHDLSEMGPSLHFMDIFIGSSSSAKSYGFFYMKFLYLFI